MTAPRTALRQIAHEAMRARGLLPAFSADVLAQVARITTPAGDDGDAIRDLRSLPWCSIDNDDTRDLDQLCVAEALADRAVKVLVAIADVDALVDTQTAIDRHARINTTSVYTAAETFPMLPEKLSTDFTSLVEGEERLTVVIELVVAADGAVTGTDVYRARVLNQAKLTYDSVASWLEGNAPAPAKVAALPELANQLRIQDSAARALRSVRYKHGALRLETTQARPVFVGGAITDVVADAKNRAKELIEDFMIASNVATAGFLERRGMPSIRRMLRKPRHWDRIVELAAEVGEKLPAEPDPAALEAFLDRRRAVDPEGFPELSLSVVKLLGKGEYELSVPGEPKTGHFGLAVRDYTHATAPNRRYPDLITQRLLKATLAGRGSPYTHDELATLARHCTQQEDDASKVERQVAKSAAALLLASRIGAQFEGIVTGASPKGTWVRVTGPAAEGRLVRGFEGLRVGDHVRVRLAEADVRRGFIDFVAA